MLESLKKSWRELAKDEPGHRFLNRYKRAQKKGSTAGRVLTLTLGSVLVLAGVVFLLIPGPGSLLIVVGAALLAEESATVARALDRTELWARPWARRLTRWARRTKARVLNHTPR